MKILELTPNLKVGGAETFVVNISNAFVDNGHECKVTTLFDPENDDFLISKLNGSVEIGSLGKSRGLDLKCFFKVYNDIRKYKPDVVHAHIGAITYLLISSVFIRSCKYYVTIHSDARREAGNWFTRIIRRFLFKFNFVLPVTISPESRDSFLDFYKKAPELIFNGVPDAKVSLYETYDRLVFVHPASCQPVKNQRLLFSAFSEVAKKYPNIELHWYGSHSPYEILFNELNPFLGDHIIYKGIVPDIRKYLKNARAMCLSSNMEGMPMTIIEAMSVGCISIATPVGGCVNMIDDGINGFLSSDMSVESYRSTLEKVIEMSVVELEQMRVAARESYEQHYTIEKTAQSYIDLFNNYC